MTEAADLSELAAPAILAWRPYPPLNLPATRSQLGGLPLLASPDDWPRDDYGTPLHFLARIDCRDLPAERGDLPGEGLLQFFARIDAGMDWNGDERSSAVRVLYTLDPGQPTPSPADLPAIQDGDNDWDRDFRLPEEPLTSVYPRWPLTFAAIPTLPYTRDAGERLGGPGPKDIESLTGFAPFERKTPEWLKESEGLRLPPHAPGEPPFPQVWVFCERIARHLACDALRIGKELSRPKPYASPQELEQRQARIAVLGRLEQIARTWIARAAAAGLDKPVGAADAEAFVAWLNEIANDPYKVMHSILCNGGGAMPRGLESAIRYCGDHPAAAALVPRELYRDLGEHHAIIVKEMIAGQPRFRGKGHQWLGYFQPSQDIEVFANEVMLLQLYSDCGVGFMFCDVGEIHFFIDEDDLAARRFDRVRAHAQGG